jgi:hypothetical protein
MSMTRALLATVVLATLSMATTLHAQSPTLTNEDVTRLVAVHVSDQTVIAAIHEAKATQFDLSATAVRDLAVKGVSPAVIAVMRQSSAPTATNPIAAPAQSQTLAHPQTLAEASEAAKAVKHTWDLSTNIGSSSLPVLPAARASTSEGTKSESTNTTTAEKDEGWWRTRMGGLRDQLAMDKSVCEPIAAKIMALQSTYDSYIFYDKNGTAKINTAAAAVIETKLVDARTEQRQCVAKVAVDQTAIDTVEEEARRLGVLPGWLR